MKADHLKCRSCAVTVLEKWCLDKEAVQVVAVHRRRRLDEEPKHPNGEPLVHLTSRVFLELA